jgi:hypothetical protein
MCKFDITHIFIQMTRKQNTLLHVRQHYSSHDQSIAASIGIKELSVWQGTKANGLSLINIWRSTIFLCDVSLNTKLMSRIRESIRTFKDKCFVEYIAILWNYGTFPASRTTSLWKYLWLRKRTVNVYHILMTSTRCVQKLTEKQLQLIRLLGYAGFRVRKFHR